jgi:prevent-host-death family protein
MIVPAGEFKAKCLKMMDDVQKRHLRITVTKHGKPVVDIIPVAPPSPKEAFGILAGTVTVNGDIVGPIEEAWEADA